MPAEVLRFRRLGDGRFKVEIWGDFLDDCGVMNVNDTLHFLQHLKLIATTPDEVIQDLREGKDRDVYIEKRRHVK